MKSNRVTATCACLLALATTGCSDLTDPAPSDGELSAARGSRASAPDFRVIELPFTAEAINDRGDILGGNKLWRRGEVISIGIHGVDINNRGQVAGYREIAPGSRRAILWQDGIAKDLGTLGGSWSEATALNDRGQVVGVSEDSKGQLKPFIWKNGRMEELDTNLVGRLVVGNVLKAVPTAVSNSGLIVGWVELEVLAPAACLLPVHQGCEPQAVAWRNGKIVLLSEISEAGELSQAHDTNGRATVGFVLTSVTSALFAHNAGILWEDGTWEILPTLSPPGGASFATAINRRGDVVGYQAEFGFSNSVLAPVLWRHGQPFDLGTPPADPNAKPSDVNSRGWVVGGKTLWIPN